MLSYVGQPNHNADIRSGQIPPVKTVTFMTSNGTEYIVHAQVLTPGQYPRIIEFSLASGQGLLHFRYHPSAPLMLNDEFVINCGFEVLKNAAEVAELGSGKFYEVYSTQKNLPSMDMLKFQIPNFIRDKQKVRLILDNDVTYVGYFESYENETAVFVTAAGMRVNMPLGEIVDIQIL